MGGSVNILGTERPPRGLGSQHSRAGRSEKYFGRRELVNCEGKAGKRCLGLLKGWGFPGSGKESTLDECTLRMEIAGNCVHIVRLINTRLRASERLRVTPRHV